MKPGYELDRIIHQKILGCTDGTLGCNTPMNYSTEMGPAWLVVEHLRQRGQLLAIQASPQGYWIVTDDKALNPHGDGTADDYDDTYPSFRYRAETPALAICLAAAEAYLPEQEMQHHRMECLLCEATVAEGHEKTCQCTFLHPETQKYLQRQKEGTKTKKCR